MSTPIEPNSASHPVRQNASNGNRIAFRHPNQFSERQREYRFNRIRSLLHEAPNNTNTDHNIHNSSNNTNANVNSSGTYIRPHATTNQHNASNLNSHFRNPNSIAYVNSLNNNHTNQQNLIDYLGNSPCNNTP